MAFTAFEVLAFILSNTGAGVVTALVRPRFFLASQGRGDTPQKPVGTGWGPLFPMNEAASCRTSNGAERNTLLASGLFGGWPE
jgi:hypothetical protein